MLSVLLSRTAAAAQYRKRQRGRTSALSLLIQYEFRVAIIYLSIIMCCILEAQVIKSELIVRMTEGTVKID